MQAHQLNTHWEWTFLRRWVMVGWTSMPKPMCQHSMMKKIYIHYQTAVTLLILQLSIVSWIFKRSQQVFVQHH